MHLQQCGDSVATFLAITALQEFLSFVEINNNNAGKCGVKIFGLNKTNQKTFFPV